MLVKDVRASADQTRLGLPPLNRRGTTTREQERRELSDSASAATGDVASGRPATAAPAKVAPAAPAAPADSGAARAKPAPAEAAPASAVRGKPGRKRKAVHSDRTSQEGAGGEVESSGGTPTKEGGSPCHGAGVFKAGRMVSVTNGRPLVKGVGLRKTYVNTYRHSQNTRLWRGQKLDLGQAFKLACFVHYGPRMPYEQSGDFETRKALFRTAAYYAMSPDDEHECLESIEFPEFLHILVATAKQMKYNIMTEARIFFGDKVFTTHRASKAFQREYFASATHDTQYTQNNA